MNIVATAVCTSRIIHTYIAKERLTRAAEGMGYATHVETQGTIGIEDELTAERIRVADVVILAIDVIITDTERFKGEKTVEVPTNVCAKVPEQLTQRIEVELNK